MCLQKGLIADGGGVDKSRQLYVRRLPPVTTDRKAASSAGNINRLITDNAWLAEVDALYVHTVILTSIAKRFR